MENSFSKQTNIKNLFQEALNIKTFNFRHIHSFSITQCKTDLFNTYVLKVSHLSQIQITSGHQITIPCKRFQGFSTSG